MSDEVELEGASLPEGIEVDEASAYFGVTESSDVIMRLNETDRLNGMGEFFALTIDLVLREDFDYETAAARLGCEGGEIYYLLSGPFGLITMTDPLRRYLGQEDSMGEKGEPPQIGQQEYQMLDSLNDVFSLMRMFAIGHLVGGLPLLDHYIACCQHLVADPAAHQEHLIALAIELNQRTQEAKTGSISPLTCLGVPQSASQPVTPPVASAPQPAPPPQPAPQPPPVPPPVAQAPPPQQSGPSQVIAANLSPQPVTQPAVEPEPQSAPPQQPEPVAPQTEAPLDDAFAAQFGSSEPADSTLPSEPIDDPLAAAFAQAEEVAPKRQPVLPSPQVAQEPQAQAPSRDSAVDAVSDLVGGAGQTTNVHHNVQSGKVCGNCGIGVEHQWAHCPVCRARLD